SGPRLAPGEAVFGPTGLPTPAAWRLWTGPDGRFTGSSSDGLTFTSTGDFRVGGQVFMTWSAITVPGRGYRVYGNFAAAGATLTSAFSADGLSWTAEPGARLSGQGANPNLESGVAPDNGAAVLAAGTY